MSRTLKNPSINKSNKPISEDLENFGMDSHEEIRYLLPIYMCKYFIGFCVEDYLKIHVSKEKSGMAVAEKVAGWE